MKIWRLYKPYHDSSESGTIEFGYYSTHERAKQRAVDVWNKSDYGEIGTADSSGSLHSQSGWGDSVSVYVSEIELDQDSDRNMCGYT